MPRGQHPNSKKALAENRYRLNSETAQKAGQNSHAVQKRKKTFREEFEAELAAIMIGDDGTKITVKNAITKAAILKALDGDMRAQEFIRDTIGEKPSENVVIMSADPDVIKEVEAMVYDTE